MRFGLACGLFALAATAFGDSIVVNGDFGTGDFTGWTNAGWDVTSASSAFGSVPTAFFADTGCVGSNCIGPGGAFISQALVTDPGGTYTLSFDYNPDAFESSPGGPSEMLVQFDGSNAIDLVFGMTPVDPQVTASTGFNTYVVSGLTASTGSTVLEFFGRQDPSGDGLTNISVTETSSSAPEPASYLMAAIGFIALGAGKLRARRR